MLEKTGVPTYADIESIFPTEERLARGPVAVIECYQSIPCDPCATACPRGAITVSGDINNLPIIDNELCTGCVLCMVKCPGLAIMCVDASFSDTQALISVPYEFLPVPEKGQTVQALNREGAYVTDAEVVRVTRTNNKVTVVSVAVNKQFIKTVRNIKVATADESIVCRCNDINLDELKNLFALGYNSIDELKHVARLGMGPCQGRTCIPIIMSELSKALGVPLSELPAGKFRPMVKSIKLNELAADGEGDDTNE